MHYSSNTCPPYAASSFLFYRCFHEKCYDELHRPVPHVRTFNRHTCLCPTHSIHLMWIHSNDVVIFMNRVSLFAPQTYATLLLLAIFRLCMCNSFKSNIKNLLRLCNLFSSIFNLFEPIACRWCWSSCFA